MALGTCQGFCALCNIHCAIYIVQYTGQSCIVFYLTPLLASLILETFLRMYQFPFIPQMLGAVRKMRVETFLVELNPAGIKMV